MIPTEKNALDQILTYTGDVHALVNHGLQAIHLQTESLKTVSHVDARTAVVEFERVLTGQKANLEARITALGGKATSPVKDAVSATLGAAAGLINKTRASETCKSIRDDYTFLSHLAVAWMMLHTTTQALGDQETASLAEKGYTETARLLMHIDKILPKIVVEELREDKTLHPVDVQNQTQSMIKNAWNRESTAQSFS
jgi:hypothetical protein